MKDRHLRLVPDLEPLEPNDLMRTVIIEPPGLTAEQRRKRKARMSALGRIVERYAEQLNAQESR